MRKEQRDFIMRKLRTAASDRLTKEMKDRPTKYTMQEYVDYLESKGIKVRDSFSAMRGIELEPNPAHEENAAYCRALDAQLNKEVSDMEIALMLKEDSDAVAMLAAALERIKGV